jgi:hypothetical protein
LALRRSNVPRTLPGGEFRSQSLQVFAATHGATRSHNKASTTERSIFVKNIFANLIDQSKVRHVHDVQRQSSLSVGICPAPKMGS